MEVIKWLIVAILLIIAIVGNNYYHDDYNMLIRLLVIVFIIGIAGSIALITNKGKSIIAFSREAKAEARKVVWPTRQETLYTTLIVAVVTAITSLILWGLDIILVRTVSFITSLRL